MAGQKEGRQAIHSHVLHKHTPPPEYSSPGPWKATWSDHHRNGIWCWKPGEKSAAGLLHMLPQQVLQNAVLPVGSLRTNEDLNLWHRSSSNTRKGSPHWQQGVHQAGIKRQALWETGKCRSAAWVEARRQDTWDLTLALTSPLLAHFLFWKMIGGEYGQSHPLHSKNL